MGTPSHFLTWPRWGAQMSPGASKLPPLGWWRAASPPHWSAPVPASAQQSDLHSSSLGLWTPSRRLLPQSQPHIHTAGQPGLCCPYPCWHRCSSSCAPKALGWLSVSLAFWKLVLCSCYRQATHLVPLPEGQWEALALLLSFLFCTGPSVPPLLATRNYHTAFGSIVCVKPIRSGGQTKQEKWV